MDTKKNNDDNSIEQDLPLVPFKHRHSCTSIISSIEQIDKHYMTSLLSYRDHRTNRIFFTNSKDKNYPILIYIYSNNSNLDLLYSDIFVDFLRENYHTYLYNISNPIDRQKLFTMCKEYFIKLFINDFTLEQYPILIGIKKSKNNHLFLTYETEIFLIDNVLIHTNEEFEFELLLYQLIVFKQEFNKDIRYIFSSNFIETIISCPELVLTICEYLSLNDAVAIFSTNVLSLLWRYNQKLPVINPSREFFDIMTKTNNLDKIIDLRIQANYLNSLMKIISSNKFFYIKSLNINKLEELEKIFINFHELIYLSLSYNNNKLDFHNIYHIFEIIPISVKYLTIHCHSISCSHYCHDIIYVKANNFNRTIKNFILYIDHTSQTLVNRCFQSYEKCILRTITDFIKIMINIRNIQIITESSIEPLLDLIEWTTSMDMCRRVEKIQLKGKNIFIKDTQLFRNIEQIKNELNKIGKSIIFDVKMQ